MKKQYRIFAIGILLGIVVLLGFNILVMNRYISDIKKEVTTDEKDFCFDVSVMRGYMADEENQTTLFIISEENASDFLNLRSIHEGKWTVDVDTDFTTFRIPLTFPGLQIDHFKCKDYYILFHGKSLPISYGAYSYWGNDSTIDFVVGYKSATLADFYNVSKLHFGAG
ncbi:MAG: hypothetical protein ACFE9L_00760 [Candidatus Hodarchaeota archaeon]